MKRMGLMAATAVVVLTVAALRASAPVSADLEGFELADPLAWLSLTGRYALVTGPMICTAGEEWEMDVALTQESSGVQAAGSGRGMCMGDVQRWVVTVEVADTSLTLVPGPAHFCAVARTLSGGTLTDTEQWCGELLLQDVRAAP